MFSIGAAPQTTRLHVLRCYTRYRQVPSNGLSDVKIRCSIMGIHDTIVWAFCSTVRREDESVVSTDNDERRRGRGRQFKLLFTFATFPCVWIDSTYPIDT